MELKNRSQYLDKLISVQDMEVIKVVTGIRRCGKSSLLKLMMAHLREQGVVEEQILSMNFESICDGACTQGKAALPVFR